MCLLHAGGMSLLFNGLRRFFEGVAFATSRSVLRIGGLGLPGLRCAGWRFEMGC